MQWLGSRIAKSKSELIREVTDTATKIVVVCLAKLKWNGSPIRSSKLTTTTFYNENRYSKLVPVMQLYHKFSYAVKVLVQAAPFKSLIFQWKTVYACQS